MYDELAKRLREAAISADSGNEISESLYSDILQAADAIEERCQQVDKFAEEAARLYAKQPKWIPVEERLPEEDAICILTNGVSNAIGYRGKVFGFHLIWTDYLEGSEVTHWMPLPEPPEEV